MVLVQARKIHLHFWSSEDDQYSKSGRPQLFMIVLKCISFQNSRNEGKIGIFVVIITQKSSSHVNDQNSISGRPQLFSGRH